MKSVKRKMHCIPDSLLLMLLEQDGRLVPDLIGRKGCKVEERSLLKITYKYLSQQTIRTHMITSPCPSSTEEYDSCSPILEL